MDARPLPPTATIKASSDLPQMLPRTSEHLSPRNKCVWSASDVRLINQSNCLLRNYLATFVPYQFRTRVVKRFYLLAHKWSEIGRPRNLFGTIKAPPRRTGHNGTIKAPLFSYYNVDHTQYLYSRDSNYSFCSTPHHRKYCYRIPLASHRC